MLELIPDLPENVVGVVASGQVTAKDYETVLIPAIESLLANQEKIRVLYHAGPAFTGFTPGAMWDDMKVGVAHWDAWEKAAVVTDVGWLAGAMRCFSFAMPCPVKLFANKEIAEATQWIAAP